MMNTKRPFFPAFSVLSCLNGGQRMARIALFSVMIPALVAGCAFPRGAALQNEVLRGTDDVESNVQVIAITRDTLPGIQEWPQVHPELRHRWTTTGASATSRIIRAGDTVSLSVWDSQPDSLLTTGAQRSVDMQNIPVSSSGLVFIPYVGEVRIASMTAERARREIQQMMTSIVPDGQVQLTVNPGSRNTIDVVTGVARPGRVELPEVSPTILSILAETGGISTSIRNPLVRLNRAGQAYAIPASELFDNPANDIQLRGGDRILVEQDDRSFISLGATGSEQTVYFDREEITALDALSMIGGLSDNRANLMGVMVLREYPESAVSQTGEAPRKAQVIFTFDLSSADGLFAARRFEIEPNDVVLASESAAPMIAQVLSMFRTARIAVN